MSVRYILYLKFTAACPEEVRAKYIKAVESFNTSRGDSGFDLYSAVEGAFVDDVKQCRIGQGVMASAFKQTFDGSQSIGFWLLPRSSIVKTPLMLANSMGLIDSKYRGELIACFNRVTSDNYVVGVGDRMVQVTTGDLTPWSEVHIVEELPDGETERGAGGFGSTG